MSPAWAIRGIRFPTSFSVGQKVRLRHMRRAVGRASPPESILDAGCGTGELTRQIARRFPGAEVVGIDDDPAIIARCQKWQARRRFDCSFRIATVAGPHLGAEFDLVLCADVMEHLTDDQEGLRWLVQHVRPGGTLVIHVPAADQHHIFSLLDQHMADQVASGEGPHMREGYDPQTLLAMADSAGLDVACWGHTFHSAITRTAVDVEQWASISGRRYVKALLLPALLAVSLREQRPSSTRPGHGLILIATRR